MNIQTLTIAVCIFAVILVIFAFIIFQLLSNIAKLLIQVDDRSYDLKAEIKVLRDRTETLSLLLKQQIFVAESERAAYRKSEQKITDEELKEKLKVPTKLSADGIKAMLKEFVFRSIIFNQK